MKERSEVFVELVVALLIPNSISSLGTGVSHLCSTTLRSALSY